MSERRERTASRTAALLCFAAVGCGCGPSAEQLRLQREQEELRHEVIEVQQYNADLKFRMQLVEARNKVLIDLVQGLTTDPEHFELHHEGATNVNASLQALDRDIDALVSSVRHSHTDLDALRAQRAALQAELAQARHTIEEARASHAEFDARIAGLRKLLFPMLSLIHAGRINVSMAYGQLTIQLPESVLFAADDTRLTAEGKVLLAQVAEGLHTANDRQYRIAGPAEERSKRGAARRQLSAARVLSVLDYLIDCRVPAANLVAASNARAQSPTAGATGDRFLEITLLPKYEELPTLPTPAQLLGQPDQNNATPAPAAPVPQAPASSSDAASPAAPAAPSGLQPSAAGTNSAPAPTAPSPSALPTKPNSDGAESNLPVH